MMDELLEEMIDPAPSRQDVARRRRAWATGAILVLAGAGAASLTTAALFTDQDELTGGISTGTVVLTAGGAQFTMPTGGLAPGGTVLAPLEVRNAGSLELRYALSLLAEPAPFPATLPEGGRQGEGLLHEHLRVRVFAGVECSVDGTTGAKPLGDSADLVDGDVGLPTKSTPLVGDPQPRAQDGDRQLGGVTTSETLCLRVDLPAETPDDLQNTASTLTFRLDSEQTVNN